MSRIEEIVEFASRIGEEEVAKTANLIHMLADLAGTPPGVTLALLAQAPQEQLDAAKTVQDAYGILLEQLRAYHDLLFAAAEQAGQELPEFDLTFIKEFAEVTGNAEDFRQGTAEAIADLERETPRPNPTVVPGSTLIH